MPDLRSIVVKIVIVSFSLAALLGIIALLGGGAFGETEGRVLLTTVVVGVESVATLCYFTTARRPSAPVGLVGGLVSLVPFGLALLLTWGGWDGGDAVWKTFTVGLTVAASLAQVCLLLTLDRRRNAGWALWATIAVIGAVAVMIIGPILVEGAFDDAYARVLGILAILDVLGTVVLAALATFGGRAEQPAAAVTLSAGLQARVAAAAHERGTTPDRLVAEALDAYL